MFYTPALIIAILIGALRSRQLKVLMLWELRAVFLLPLALFTGLIPLWLGTYWPVVIWTDDRNLLMILQATARSLFLLFVLINLYIALTSVDWTGIRRSLRHLRSRPSRPAFGTESQPRSRNMNGLRKIRRLQHMRRLRRPDKAPVNKQLKDFAQALPGQILNAARELPGSLMRLGRHIYQRLLSATMVHPRHVLAPDKSSPMISRHANRLRLTGLSLAVFGLTGQMLVLLTNQGYWPLSVRYLDYLSDPLLVEGIRNGALRLSRLVDNQTSWHWLGQVIPWPSFDKSAPARFIFISVTDLILALSLFLTTLSLFPSRKDQ